MRLFIAIELNDAIRDGLAEMQAYMRAHGVRGNFTRTENLHLTLAFIGEYGDPERVLEAMASVPFEVFPIRLDGFGSFGDLYWTGIGESKPLAAYVRRLRRTLAESSIPFDRKRFSPHITLVRRAAFDRRLEMSGVAVPDAVMTVESVSLFRSDRGKNGMVYTELGHAVSEAG